MFAHLQVLDVQDDPTLVTACPESFAAVHGAATLGLRGCSDGVWRSHVGGVHGDGAGHIVGLRTRNPSAAPDATTEGFVVVRWKEGGAHRVQKQRGAAV